MPVETIYTLAASNITISGGVQLSGFTQGSGAHLNGRTITLNNNNWDAVEVFDTDPNFADNDSSQQLEGARLYDGNPFPDNARVEAEYILELEDPDGNTYFVLGFNINEPGVTSFATVEGLAFIGGVGGFPPIGVPLTVVSSGEPPATPFSALATPLCFTSGCMIETPEGDRLIDDLAIGDRVVTMTHGPQPIQWIGSNRLPSAAMRNRPGFQPIRIMAGALGKGLPRRDLLVSRQHRVLISSRVAERIFDTTELLIPAIKLTDLPGIFVDDTITEITYFHILFDRHQVIFAEGAPTESLYTGAEALKSVPAAARTEILALFPQLAETDQILPPPAFPIPKGKKLKDLVARHHKNGKPLLEMFRSPTGA